MENSLIKNIINVLSGYDAPILIIENNDGFLARPDVIAELERNLYKVSIGTGVAQRIAFELRDNETILLLINKEHRLYLEDMEEGALRMEFFLGEFLPGYHIPSIKKLPLPILNELFGKKQLLSLSRTDTLKLVESITSLQGNERESFDFEGFQKLLKAILSEENPDWKKLSLLVGNSISTAIGTTFLPKVLNELKNVNIFFQEYLEEHYAQIKNSNPLKRPQIVSKIMDYLDFNFQKDKVALIVIDGLSFWQYTLISNKLPGNKIEDMTFSWIPSITQLSRQAIFRGNHPQETYTQNPSNESKLWKEYWRNKNFNEFEIEYQYAIVDTQNLDNVKRLAIVYKDLDDYMHSSRDYEDLLKLTENWFKRCKIGITVEALLNQNYEVFITSDHGNIQAKGWRGLKGKEKLGTNKSGSRSMRHIEYSENRLKEEFLSNNPELLNSIVQDEKAIYFKDDLSFSGSDQLVSHGGAHFLEVAIPFIQIKNG